MLALSMAGAARASDIPELHHVKAVRFWSLGDVTRIAVETDGDFQLKYDHLDNPARLFYDLYGTRPRLGHKSLTVIKVGDRFVKQIRVAAPQPDVTRVVLDLERPVDAITSRLDNPERLIIEVRARGAKAPVTNPPSANPAPPRQETTKLPPKTPPTLVAPAIVQPAPTPAPKPVQRKRFTPPPSGPEPQAQPLQVQNASLDPPPALTIKPAADFAGARLARIQPVLATAIVPTPEPSLPASVSPAPSLPPSSSSPAEYREKPLPAKRELSGDRSLIRVLDLKIRRVVLDPGHGGHDTGTIGPDGLEEKDLVLDVAQRLGRLIETKMGAQVIYTRTDDTFIPLERRTEIANQAKADLFLSIHANSSPAKSASGIETFYLNFTTSRSALETAARENAGSNLSIYDLQDLLQKIVLKDKVEESREFATRVQSSLFALAARSDARSKNRGVKRAPFVVLIGAQMPSVLAEIGFISNPRDARLMRREAYRQRIAEALYKGVSGYANSLSHFQVAERRR